MISGERFSCGWSMERANELGDGGGDEIVGDRPLAATEVIPSLWESLSKNNILNDLKRNRGRAKTYEQTRQVDEQLQIGRKVFVEMGEYRLKSWSSQPPESPIYFLNRPLSKKKK